jgi:hypothetical protein
MSAGWRKMRKESVAHDDGEKVVISNLNLKLSRTSFFIAVPKLDRFVPNVGTRLTCKRAFL